MTRRSGAEAAVRLFVTELDGLDLGEPPVRVAQLDQRARRVDVLELVVQPCAAARPPSHPIGRVRVQVVRHDGFCVELVR